MEVWVTKDSFGDVGIYFGYMPRGGDGVFVKSDGGIDDQCIALFKGHSYGDTLNIAVGECREVTLVLVPYTTEETQG